METANLIDRLAQNLEPIQKARRSIWLFTVLTCAVLVVMIISTLMLGPRDFAHGGVTMMLLKVGFAASLVLLGARLISRLSKPDQCARPTDAIVLAPIIFIALMAIREVLGDEGPHVGHLLNSGWVVCVVSIPLLASIPYGLIAFVIRRFGAPTDLTSAGLYAGLTAGGIGALGYALHCNDDSLAFIAVWYVVAIMLCGIVGRALGSRLLRW